MELILYIVVLLALQEPPTTAPVRAWGFEAEAAGQAPRGFSFDVSNDRDDGKWRVVEDGGNKVLTELERKRERRRFATALVRDESIREIRLSVKIKAVGGEAEMGGGLVWRYRNPGNYLGAGINVRQKTIVVYRMVNGNWIKFAGAEGLKLEANKWYTLRVVHKGEKINVYLDDEMVVEARDRHFRRAGRFGVRTFGDAATYFDDLTVLDLDDD